VKIAVAFFAAGFGLAAGLTALPRLPDAALAVILGVIVGAVASAAGSVVALGLFRKKTPRNRVTEYVAPAYPALRQVKVFDPSRQTGVVQSWNDAPAGETNGRHGQANK
jgi:hypothetical protein